MRLSTPLIIVCTALAAIWVQAAAPPPPESQLRSQPAPDAARLGFSARLSELGAAPLGAAAAEASTSGLWRLRGRAARRDGPAEGWPAPLYAEADPLCDDRLERAACWRVTRLEIDGRTEVLP